MPGIVNPAPIILMLLAIPMFIFGKWGRNHALDLAGSEALVERRARKQKSIQRGGMAWQIFGAVSFITGLILIFVTAR